MKVAFTVEILPVAVCFCMAKAMNGKLPKRCDAIW